MEELSGQAPGPVVAAVCASPAHGFSKTPAQAIRILQGFGVAGDCHGGATVQHRSRVARDPSQPNLRQVHLIHAELFEELAGKGFAIRPGDLGENVTTAGLDLLALPAGTVMRLGPAVTVRLTGLRNPCRQLDDFRPGLMTAVLDRDAAGRLVRKAGVMAIVLEGGEVRVGDPIAVELPPGEPVPLAPV